MHEATVVGENGFVNLTIQSAFLTLDYRDISNTSLLTEQFKPEADGTLAHKFEDPGLLASP